MRRLFSSGKSKSSAFTCQYCKSSLGTNMVHCESCHKIQPVPTHVDPFLLFSMPHKYLPFAANELQSRLFALQRKVHPDVVGDERGCGEVVAHGWSALINQSYSQLRDPIMRGRLLLKDAEESEEQERLDDLDFLTDVMLLREKIEGNLDDTQLQSIKSQLDKQIDDLMKQVASALEAKDHDEARIALQKLKYLRNISDAISNNKETTT